MITGKIQKVEESTDDRKNIIIYVNFYRDGELIYENWKYAAMMENFLGMTKDQISDWIGAQIKYQIGNLIKSINRTDINSTVMAVIDTLKDVEYQSASIDVEMPENTIIETAYTVTIGEDGTLTKNIEDVVEA